MRRAKNKKRKIHIPWGYCLAIAIVVLIFCVSFIQFDNESENNTRLVTGTVTNLEYGTNAFECYESRFYSYALFGLLDEWIKRGFYESVEQMAENVNKICNIKK